MKLTKKRLKEVLKFNKLVEDFVVQHGAVPMTPLLPHHYMMATKFGSMRVSVHQVEGFEQPYLTVFCCFETPQLAMVNGGPLAGKTFGDNGKWNHHYGEKDDPVETFETWKREMSRVLIPT